MTAQERLDLINKEQLESSSINELSYIIYELTRLWNPKVVVEIGISEGCSTLCILHGLSSESFLYSYDIQEIRKNAIANVAVDDLVGKWIPNHLSSDAGFELWDKDKAIDLLFIDGDHTNPQMYRDYYNWSQYVRVGGLIMFHDALLDTERLTKQRYVVSQLCKEIGALVIPYSQGLGIYIKPTIK